MTINELVPFAGPCLTILGFIFVSRQLRLAHIALKAQTRTSLYQMSQTAYRLFIDQPDLRPYFYESRDLPVEEPLRSKTLAAAEYLCDYFEHIYHSKDLLQPDLREAWLSYIQMIHDSSVVLRYFSTQMSSQYSPAFLAHLTMGAKKRLGSTEDANKPLHPTAGNAPV